MSILQPTPVGPTAEGGQADAVDPLLRAFFRAEMPQRWPAFEPPAAPLVPREGVGPRCRSRFRGRAVLAASVGLLLLGHLSVSGPFRESPAVVPGFGGEGVAGRPDRSRPVLRKAEPNRSQPVEQTDWLPEREGQSRRAPG
jgi:hypothetical protein